MQLSVEKIELLLLIAAIVAMLARRVHAEVCRKMGISEATFYNWKKKYGGLGADELRRLRQLEEENSRLKQIVADLTLDKQMLQDVLKKSFKKQAAKTAGGSAADGLSSVRAAGLRGGAVV
jgi:putative transposase